MGTKSNHYSNSLLNVSDVSLVTCYLLESSTSLSCSFVGSVLRFSRFEKSVSPYFDFTHFFFVTFYSHKAPVSVSRPNGEGKITIYGEG